MPALITIDEACAQLNMVKVPLDAYELLDLRMKMDQASDAVVRYVTEIDKLDWTSQTVPPNVKAGILLLLRVLYDDRAGESENYFTPGSPICNLLRRHRDPSVA